MKQLVRLALSLVLVLALGLAPGCAGNGEPSVEPADTETPTETVEPTETVAPTETVKPTKTVQRLLYFNRGEYLGVAGRQVEVGKDLADTIGLTIEQLLAGPKDDPDLRYGLTGTSIPAGTTLNGVKVKGDVATVDLSKTFESGGGSLSMLLRVAQVVYTATQFDGIKRVAFMLDGKPVKAIGGEGVVVSPPVSRSDFEGQLPAILVEAPVPGQEIAGEIALRGSADVFEAQFTAEVENSKGKVESTTLVMATSGTGTRGTFDAEAFSYGKWAPGGYTVVFFEPSPKDGSKTNIIEIPITIVK